MTELEDIAKRLGNLVRYRGCFSVLEDKKIHEFESGYEFEHLFYSDNHSWIHASRSFSDDKKKLDYWIDVTKLDFYIENLKKLDIQLAKIIVAELQNRTREKPPNINKALVGKDFIISDYRDLSELIRVHVDISS